ncbi:hypothetical protein [Acinetobacter sp. ANC 5378]|uniref:hypothetical protein n=1 Tax=Acinetobacter sp. ANC 5378 TaxID=2731249 RepID=UPI00148F5DC4|nr:hypothetical protein [Acinetobacter sp. ANC 5378]NNG82921.1 hypothetical protein [Acinetobacter sp. ANC 5378]
MEICTVDWKAISGLVSAIIGATVAWAISEKWRGQKASEEISKECKELWTKLDELEKLYNILDDLRELPVGLEYKSNIKDKFEIRKLFFSNVKEWTYLNLSKLEYIKVLTNNDEILVKNVDLLTSNLDSFYTQRLLQRFINDNDLQDHVKNNEVLSNIKNLKNSLVPFIKFSKST